MKRRIWPWKSGKEEAPKVEAPKEEVPKAEAQKEEMPKAELLLEQSLEQQYGEKGNLDVQLTLQYLLHVSLHKALQMENVVEQDHIRLPAWNAVLRPEIAQLNERGIVMNFYLEAPQWGRMLFECSVGMGNDPRTNLGMATGSFLFSFLQGIERMENQEKPELLTTSFAGTEHRWKVYNSDIVGMGNTPKVTDFNIYWDALREEIAKRLGNQRLCFVKIYGAKMGDDITGECRIDDIKNEALSKMVADIIAKWENEGFGSHKQFFFIRQEEATALPYPYEGSKGAAALKEKVIQATKMFHESRSQEEFDTLEERMAEALGDATLAAECRYFLPEICAENAFSEAEYSEVLDIQRRGADRIQVYKNQLADYYLLWNALFSAFSEGIFGEETNEIYQEYIGCSAIYSVICKMQNAGSRLEDARLTALLFQVGKDFVLR